MKVSAKSQSSFAPAPEGNHIARCIGVIDLGTQQGEYKGKAIESRQVLIQFELVNEEYSYEKDGETITKKHIVKGLYTASIGSKAKLGKLLTSWRGKPFTKEEEAEFDLNKILGLACMVQINHSEDGKYANIEAITSLPKGFTAPEAENKFITFDIDGENTDIDKLESLPEWIRTIIYNSNEMRKLYGITTIAEDEKNIDKEIKGKTITEVEKETAQFRPQPTKIEEVKVEDVEDLFGATPPPVADQEFN